MAALHAGFPDNPPDSPENGERRSAGRVMVVLPTINPRTELSTQVSTTAAEAYEEFFVPALFAQWAAPMLDAVDARLGERLIDIGTGTGVLATAALRRVGPTGSVIAVDPKALPDAEAIKAWIDYSLKYVKTLPAK